jgi:hypothetical protein
MDIVKDVVKELTKAREYSEQLLSKNSRDAYAYFDGVEPKILDKDVQEYFQDIVSPDVANAVEHTLADIMPAFASETPVSFNPMGPEDEEQVRIETQLVNDIFIQQSNGFIQLTTACKNALLQRIGVVEVNTYEKAAVSYLKVEDATIDILVSLKTEDTEIIELDGKAFDDDAEIDSAKMAELLDKDSFSATLRQTKIQKHLYIDAFPPNELFVNPDHEELDLDSARFVARERLLSRSELVQLGYDKELVAGLPDYSYNSTAKPHRQREYALTDTKMVHVAFCYMLLDEDDDGIAERRRIVLAGNLTGTPTILEDEPAASQPYCIGVPFIYPHRVPGISLFDKIKQVQDIKTKVVRQLLTAGETAVRGRLGIVGNQVNINDVKDSIFGGMVRMTTPNGVVPIPTNPFPSEVFQLLTLMDQRRKESGGSAVDKASEEVLIGGDTAHGLERIMSAMEQLNSLMAKVLAETLLRQIYTKIHYNLRTNFSQPIAAKVQGNWITATPSSWPERQHVSVALGLTMGDRLRQAQSYTQLIAEQKELMQQGSILVDEKKMYRLLVARANALMVPNAHTYYTDPASPEGQQAAQARTQSAQQKNQQDMQVQMMNMELLPRVEQIKAEGSANVQMLKNQMEQLSLKFDQQLEYDKLAKDYDALRLQLVELNAKYDAEQVPDSLQ